MTQVDVLPASRALEVHEPLVQAAVAVSAGELVLGGQSQVAGLNANLLALKADFERSGIGAEQRLVGHFDELVRGLDISELAVESGEKPISGLESFEFVPVVSTRSTRASADTAGYSVRTEQRIRTTYGGGDGKPYLDAGQAIGLAYGGRLVAVAAAGIDGAGRLKVVQIQDVSGVRKTAGKEFYRTGLHNGMLWRDTLVRAWETIGDVLGLDELTVQSNTNNEWYRVQQAKGKGYDDVAQRMGYVLDTSGNWTKRIRVTETSSASTQARTQESSRWRRFASRLLVVF